MESKIFCKFNMDAGCAELRMSGGTRISIRCTAAETEAACNMCRRSDPDYLICNPPAALYLSLNGGSESHLNAVTEYK